MYKKYVFLLLTGLLFGSQFIITTFALKGYTALEIGMMRIVFGMITVAILAAFFFREKSNAKIPWYYYALIGFLEGTVPCVLVPWGQIEVQSAIAGVIICTMPIFAMIFGPIFIKSEKYDWLSFLSIIVGFIGVYILLDPGSQGGWVKGIIPELAILVASASWALSLVFIKKMPEESPFIMTRNILLAASIEIIPIWLIWGHPSQMHFATVPFISSVVLGVFNAGIVYIFYVFLIRLGGVNFAAFSNYLVPIVAGALAIIFLNEKLTAHEIVGFIVIILGLAIQSWHNAKTHSS